MNRFLSIIAFALLIPLASFAFEEDNAARIEYITTWKDEAILQMAEHKIPASITLAQGILESGDGMSRLAKEGNNHFGIKCHNDWQGGKMYHDDDAKGECFRKYRTAHESYEDHSIFLKKKRYEPLFKLDADDYKGWAKGLKECGYATNPKYPQLLITIIENFDLAQYDKIGMDYIRKGKLPEGGSKPVANTKPDSSQEQKKNTKTNKRSRDDKEERMNITIAHNRQVSLSDNRIKYVVVKSGDTQESIARDMEMNPWQIKRYNDFSGDEKLKEGQIIYLQPKRNKAKEKTHTVQKGDNLWSISQKHGIKLKKLCKINELEPNSELSVGKVIKLQK